MKLQAKSRNTIMFQIKLNQQGIKKQNQQPKPNTMNKRASVCVALGALALFAGTAAQAQSSYSNAVAALNPVAYWPLTETVAPPATGMYIATNLGSAQAAGNGYYETWWTNAASSYALTNVNNIVHVPGAIQGDSDTAMAISGTGQYLVWPRCTNGVANSAVTLTPPYSIEMWCYVASASTSTRSLFAEGGNLVQTGPEFGGLLAQEGIEIGMNTNHFYFKTYNGPGGTGTSLATTAAGVTTNGNWYHLVFTCDGTNKVAYVNSVAVSQTLTAMNLLGQVYMTDLVSPMILGNGDELDAGSSAPVNGDVDEFAIYTNVLSAAQVAAHYAAGTNAATVISYKQTVLDDNPTIYTRLDEPSFTGPSLASLPVATNYGSLGASANGLYQPGTAPGSPGPAYSGFGSSNYYAVAINGFNGGVDVGGGTLPALLNPTAKQPLTVMTWFRGNPADAGPRYQDLVSHGTNSYRLGLDLTPGNFFNPGAGPQLAFTGSNDMLLAGMNLNDGQWHMAAGVSDGTNENFYLDGLLVKSGTSVANIPGNPRDLILGGDPFFLGPLPTTTAGYRGGLFYDGSIAQVACFTNALTTAQIQQVFSAANVPPVIHQQPTNSVLAAYPGGTNLAFVATVSGSLPISYQWYTNGVAVSGQTNASLIISNTTISESGSYYLVATNLYGDATSAVVNLTIYGPPVLTQASLPILQVFAGSSPILNMTILGTPPFTYQWTTNSVSISGATNSSYTVNTSQQGTTTYIGSVTNSYGAVYVTNTVTVIADPTAPYPVAVLADSPMAYFRLDESSGTTAYDYVGGNNATYTNVLLAQPGYSPSEDPSEVAAEFGDYGSPANNNLAGNVPAYLSFATNTGNAEFSVEAWVKQYVSSADDGIVTLGYGGANQFSLDTGATGNCVRFGVRNAANVSSLANSSVLVYDGYWHHVVGVCDEAGGHIYLYVDGVLAATSTITPGSGILSSSIPLSIGARESANNNPVSYDYQFIGEIDDVAIYNQALSATQVQNHYFAIGVPPVITRITPSSQTVDLGNNAAFTVSAIGATPLTYQWYDNNSSPISWGTNATLNLTNVQSIQAGTYSVTVTDPYNSASANASLAVDAGPPVISVDLNPTNAIYYAGSSNTFTVSVLGSPPFSYQWYQDGAPIGGATNSSFTYAALLGTNTYYCAVTNIYSAGTPTLSSIGTVAGIVPPESLSSTNFSYKIKIQFSGYNRNEKLEDFPVLVRFGTNVSGFSYAQFASPTGGDLRFADSSGTISLPYEIDQWDDTNGNSTIWVQVPTLSGTNDFIWAYWGNPNDTTPADYTTNGAVWLPPAFQSLPSYEVVYHLEQSGFPYLDSTLQYPASNGIAPASVAGLIGQGLSFNDAPYLDAGLVNLGNAFTLSAWVNVPASDYSIQAVWDNGNGVADSPECQFYVDNFDTSDGTLTLTTGDGSTQVKLQSAPGAVSFGQWHLVTAVADRTDGVAQLFVDGNQVTNGLALTDFPTNTDMNLGRDNGGSYQYTGLIDEARIRSGLSSTNWIWADWMTVAENSTFESYAAVSSSIVTLDIQHSGNNVILTWAEGTLQSASVVTGPYSDIPAVTSPYTNTVSGTQEFYRVRIQ